MKKKCVLEKKMLFLCARSGVQRHKIWQCCQRVSEKKLFLNLKRSFPIVENDLSDNCSWIIIGQVIQLSRSDFIYPKYYIPKMLSYLIFGFLNTSGWRNRMCNHQKLIPSLPDTYISQGKLVTQMLLVMVQPDVIPALLKHFTYTSTIALILFILPPCC